MLAALVAGSGVGVFALVLNRTAGEAALLAIGAIVVAVAALPSVYHTQVEKQMSNRRPPGAM